MSTYVGRFAPSPTGHLHIGSLLAAFASYVDAKAHNGRWLVRIEDLDPPREIAGAADNILRTLEAFGFEWDNQVVYQSQRHHLYEEALETLKKQNLVYSCTCSRKQWQENAKQGIDGWIYNGHCAHISQTTTNKTPAWRLRVNHQEISFQDRIVGFYSQNLAEEIGDFILLRADGFWAYQLAVVVDDAEQGITHIVRGQDLLISTPRQIFLQQCLNFQSPQYAHLPLLTNIYGQKWSKQTLAPALNLTQQEILLRQVSDYLNIPTAPKVSYPKDLLDWAIQNWDIQSIPKQSICTEN
ncbi:tRNA glutamyl-Q(34) synthetase GluQRS [Conchiformibius steedae]|uniref:tRNA glutamyl-Q(34) synthetase GluQRS n=1 Tax=Conchiformibius steedae TaxID=153493 RepID=UPI0026EFF28C|nr:tRNA glutamyl-Q(34) synthetase GluQRS [Conchiformibius steedae]